MNQFTSESVCAGHPDKLCDQISDAILDAVLREDPQGRVAVESLATRGKVVVAGEVSAHAHVDYAQVAREQIQRLGYHHPELLFSKDTPIEVMVHTQSPEIAQGVKKRKGAGDQGMMFGYACTETPALMPAPIMIAHALAAQLDQLRESGQLSYLLPDGKTQVTLQYQNHLPIAVTQVVMAAPHQTQVELAQVREDLFQLCILPVLDQFGFSVTPDQVIVNGTGVWHLSGPAADTGLTGRKIIVDTYGGYARVGGGAFSGKDPSKVDRSGAYAARYLAKNIVASGLATQVEVSLSYCIGQPLPVMKNIETFGTNLKPMLQIEQFTNALLDCSVEGILDQLKLKAPIYLPTAAYGHFGRPGFAWEQLAK